VTIHPQKARDKTIRQTIIRGNVVRGGLTLNLTARII